MIRWPFLPLISAIAVISAAGATIEEKSFPDRLAAAKSVKVQTEILGVGIGSSVESVHARLDALAGPDGRPKEEAKEDEEAEGEEKLFWNLSESEFSSVFIKADAKERVTYILATLRPDNQIPFEQIGEVRKAPIQNEKVVAWDVVRENGALVRVVARGAKRKAATITIFLVKRPAHPSSRAAVSHRRESGVTAIRPDG